MYAQPPECFGAVDLNPSNFSCELSRFCGALETAEKRLSEQRSDLTLLLTKIDDAKKALVESKLRIDDSKEKWQAVCSERPHIQTKAAETQVIGSALLERFGTMQNDRNNFTATNDCNKAIRENSMLEMMDLTDKLTKLSLRKSVSEKDAADKIALIRINRSIVEKELQDLIVSLSEQVSQVLSLRAEAMHQLRDSDYQFSQSHLSNSKLQTELEETNSAIQVLQNDEERICCDVVESRKTASDIKDEICEHKQTINIIVSKFDSCVGRRLLCTQELDVYDAKVKSASVNFDELTTDALKLASRITGFKETIKDLTVELNEQKACHEDLLQRDKSLMTEMDQCNNEIKHNENCFYELSVASSNDTARILTVISELDQLRSEQANADLGLMETVLAVDKEERALQQELSLLESDLLNTEKEMCGLDADYRSACNQTEEKITAAANLSAEIEKCKGLSNKEQADTVAQENSSVASLEQEIATKMSCLNDARSTLLLLQTDFDKLFQQFTLKEKQKEEKRAKAKLLEEKICDVDLLCTNDENCNLVARINKFDAECEVQFEALLAEENVLNEQCLQIQQEIESAIVERGHIASAISFRASQIQTASDLAIDVAKLTSKTEQLNAMLEHLKTVQHDEEKRNQLLKSQLQLSRKPARATPKKMTTTSENVFNMSSDDSLLDEASWTPSMRKDSTSVGSAQKSSSVRVSQGVHRSTISTISSAAVQTPSHTSSDDAAVHQSNAQKMKLMVNSATPVTGTSSGNGRELLANSVLPDSGRKFFKTPRPVTPAINYSPAALSAKSRTSVRPTSKPVANSAPRKSQESGKHKLMHSSQNFFDVD